MSVLRMMSCDACGTTSEGVQALVGDDIAPPRHWLEVDGPAVTDEVARYRFQAPKRHVCSPACLAKLGESLAGLPHAIKPGVDEYEPALDD